MIPHILHQIWLGREPLPDDFAGYVEGWRRFHPGWEYHLWTEETLPHGCRREVYERLRAPAERSDILRLELLARFGGVYLDTDFECLRPIDPLVEGLSLFAADLNPGRLANAFLGAPAQHPAILRALAELRPVTRFGPIDKRGTGPLFIDRVLREEGVAVIERRLVETRRELAATGPLERLRAARDDRIEFALRARNKARHAFAPRVDLTRARVGGGRRGPTRVPKVLHHVWVEPGEIPADTLVRIKSWRLCHADWEHRLWREEDLPAELVRPEAGDPLRSPAEREELLRLELVHRHGGVAVDHRLVCRRRLDASIRTFEAFAMSNDKGVPDAGLVGAVPGHPAISRALERAEPYEWFGYPTGRTGVAALDRAAGAGLVVLPARLFRGARALAVAVPDPDSTEERRRLFEEAQAMERRLHREQVRLARYRGEEPPFAAGQDLAPE